MEFALIIIVFLALAGGLAYLSYRARQRRLAELQTFAQRHNLYFTERDDSILQRWSAFKGAFDDGFDHQARNVLSGAWEGHQALVFEFRFYTWETTSNGAGGTSTTKEAHDRAVVALETGEFFPLLSVTPEGMFSRMLGRITGNDINLEWEDFNRAFTVRCHDRKLATDVLTQPMMELLMREPRRGWTLFGPDIMVISEGRLQLERVPLMLQLLTRSTELIPDHVKEAAGSEAPSTLERP